MFFMHDGGAIGLADGCEGEGESTVSDTGRVRDSLDEMKNSRSVRLGRCACAAGDTAEHKL